MKPLWLVGAAALGAFLVVRRRALEPTLLAGGALVAVAMAVYGTGVVEFPDIETLLVDIGETLGRWTYLLVGVLAFLETGAFVGLIAPGETALLIGGLVAGQGKIDLLTLIAIVWSAAVAGDLTSFILGRRLGRAFLVRHGPKVSITEERLHTVEGFFDRHGGKAILIGRFVGIVRAVAPFLAGSSGMTLRRFMPYDVIGAGLWGSAFVVLGYVFWQSFDRLLEYAKQGALALGTTITVVIAIAWAVRWLRRPANRRRAGAWLERQAERPGLRPVARVLRPVLEAVRRPARFVWSRLTPGDLGLELTTLLAVLAVGTFAYVYIAGTLQEQAFLAGDTRVLEVATDVEAGVAVTIAKVVTALGSFPAAMAVVALASVLLLWRRELVETLVLVAGLGLTYAGVHVANAAVDRTRPVDALIETAGSSFPSDHAAYAVTWVAVAVVLGRVLPTLAARFAFVTVSIVIAALVPLSRVYLRANYLSDVSGGVALAAVIFALCGLVALVVGYLRDNPPRPPPVEVEPVPVSVGRGDEQ